MFKETISEFATRLMNVIYSFGIADFLDICLVAFIIYQVIKLLRETRAFQLIKGLLLVLVVYAVIKLINMQASAYLFKSLFDNIIIVLIILFQPEIRHALESAGRTGFKKISGLSNKNEEVEKHKQVSNMVNQFVKSAIDMSEKKIGSLTVFERNTLLGEIIKTGTIVDAKATEQMFSNVFYPKAPLHDGAAIVRDGRIYAAGCILPLTQNNNVSKELGTRHRAAIGMSEQSDAILIITSEETGVISIAEKGVLRRNLSEDELTNLLTEGLSLNESNGKKHNMPSFFEMLKEKLGGKNDE